MIAWTDIPLRAAGVQQRRSGWRGAARAGASRRRCCSPAPADARRIGRWKPACGDGRGVRAVDGVGRRALAPGDAGDGRPGQRAGDRRGRSPELGLEARPRGRAGRPRARRAAGPGWPGGDRARTRRAVRPAGPAGRHARRRRHAGLGRARPGRRGDRGLERVLARRRRGGDAPWAGRVRPAANAGAGQRRAAVRPLPVLLRLPARPRARRVRLRRRRPEGRADR